MKKYILGTILSLGLLVSPAFVPQAEAAAPTALQISVIVQLLQAFGMDQSTIASVQTALGGDTFSTGGATLKVNGLTSATNVDPMLTRTWTWSGTSGGTYTASGVISGCDNSTQNGVVSNWAPWTGGTGTASSGSSSAIPGTTKYGCTITGTYKVTSASGQVGTATASITFKHSTNTTIIPATTGSAVTITTGSTLHPIQSDHYWNFNLAYTGGVGTPTWSLVSGALPATIELDPAKGTINNNNYFNHSPISVNNHIPEGTYTFTVKVTVGSQSATKQLSLEVRPLSDRRPIIMFDQKLNNAVNELIQGGDGGIPGTYHFYYFPSTENDVCTIVSGQLPSGISFKSSVNGCMISGAPTVTGTFGITWKIENQYGSDTADYPITIFTPGASITTSASSLPDATIGEPYSYQFPITQTGNITATDISNIRFSARGGMPPGLSIDGLTGFISGTPTVAGTYNPNISFGVSTEMYLSHQVTLPLIVKPRTQSSSGLTADIMSAMNSLSWTTSNSAQSALSFRDTMAKRGWTLNDVAVATGYKMGDLAKTLYPNTLERSYTLMVEIQKVIDTFDWSDANKHQSALSFRDRMITNGWTLNDILFGSFTLSGYGVAKDEIKAVVTANPI